MNHTVLVAGAGNIGSLISQLLANTNEYQVYLVDASEATLNNVIQHKNIQSMALDITDDKLVKSFMANKNIEAVVACLPYFHSMSIAKIAHQYGLHYFDLTEDVEVTNAVKELAKDQAQAYVPGCGLAPGFVNIVANSLAASFDELDIIKLRAGNLPINTSNALQYALTWSTDGLINEYGNMCSGIVENKESVLLPLEGMEYVDIDGTTYESFNTSGGIGTLVDSYLGKVTTLNYKTLRYPGHRDKVAFLMKDLKLNDDRELLKNIFERAMPVTNRDVMIVYVSVTGKKNGRLVEENYLNKIYSQDLIGRHRAAIQITTASGLCAVLDIILNNPKPYHGFVKQEQFSMEDVVENQFGGVFKS